VAGPAAGWASIAGMTLPKGRSATSWIIAAAVTGCGHVPASQAPVPAAKAPVPAAKAPGPAAKAPVPAAKAPVPAAQLPSPAAQGTPTASAAGAPARSDDRMPTVHAGRLAWTGTGYTLARCDGGTVAVRDLSPENMITAIATDLGAERSPIHLEAFARPAPDGRLDLVALSRAATEARCPPAGAPIPVWRALGNEPFWSVAVADDGRLTLSAPGAADRVLDARRAAGAAPAGTAAGRAAWAPRESARWEATDAQGRAVALSVSPAPCRDTMADAVYGWRAELSIGGAVERGCAWRLR
jgi:uncharacterized membrane protein